MKGFPKKIATGNDLYNCLSLVQAGELPANELSAAIEAVEERQYIAVPIVEISEDRKTVVINPCAEVAAGVKVKNNYTTTIKEARAMEEGEKVLKVLSDVSPFEVLGISADEVKSIKGVLKNYALSDK